MRPIYNIVSNSASCTSLGPNSETTIITSSSSRQNINSCSPSPPTMRSRSMNSSNNHHPPRVRLSNDPNLDHLSISPQSAASPFFSSSFSNSKKFNKNSYTNGSNNNYKSLLNVSSPIGYNNNFLNMPTTPNTPNHYDNKYQFLFQSSSSPAYGSSFRPKFMCDPHLDSPAITTISSNIDTTSLFSPSKIVKQQKQTNLHPSFKDRFNYQTQFFNNDPIEMLTTSSTNNKNIIDQQINFNDYKNLILKRNKYDLNNNNDINECYLKSNNFNMNGRQSIFDLFYILSTYCFLFLNSYYTYIIIIVKCNY